MGRKIKTTVKKNPSRGLSRTKAKKIDAKLVFPAPQDEEKPPSKLSHRQKQRLMKRKFKAEEKLSKGKTNKRKLQEASIVLKNKKKKIELSRNETDSDSDIEESELNQQNGSDELKEALKNTSDIGDDDDEDNSDAGSVVSRDDEPESFDEIDDNESDAEKLDLLASDSEGSDDDDHVLKKKDSDDSDSDESGWSEAEREADELEAAEGRRVANLAAKIAEEDGEIPPLEDVLREIKETPNIKRSLARAEVVVNVLEKFSERREEKRKRKEYLDILVADLCLCYSYNRFLLEKFMDLFKLPELMEFLQANEHERPVTLRSNSIKCIRKNLRNILNNRGVNVQDMPWTKVGMVVYGVPSNTPLGATPEYLAGHYILQGASSLLPVMALAPKEHEFILDMCAAPGGKATHIAAMMKNTGILYCNDVNPNRVKALAANVHRMGITNTIISSMDGRKLVKKMENSLDRVLLDAPCTGTGIISKDERVKLSKSEMDVKRCAHLQMELLLAAIDAVNSQSETGGYIVYSTCSILVEENEQVLNSVLKKRHVKLVPTGLSNVEKGLTKFKNFRFHQSLELVNRIYPHKTNMDGFCVAKLKKLSNGLPSQNAPKK